MASIGSSGFGNPPLAPRHLDSGTSRTAASITGASPVLAYASEAVHAHPSPPARSTEGPTRNPDRGGAYLDEAVLLTTRSRKVCMTCHWFRHHAGVNCIPLLTCQLHQGWTDDVQRNSKSSRSAPPVAAVKVSRLPAP